MAKKFPHYKQADAKDCGATCLKIIAKHYGRTLNIQTLRELSETTREGANLLSLSEAAEQIGFRTLGVVVVRKLLEAFALYFALEQNHYVVLFYDIVNVNV